MDRFVRKRDKAAVRAELAKLLLLALLFVVAVLLTACAGTPLMGGP